MSAKVDEMKILFINPNSPDYLSSGLFHGLRSIVGGQCVDLPRFDCMYKPLNDSMRAKIRGHGFTLYGLLEDMPELVAERFLIWHKNIHSFDYYIISDIWNCWETYIKLSRIVPPKKIILIDPSDTFRFYPFNSYKTDPHLALFKFLFHSRSIKYFKREISDNDSERLGLDVFSGLLSRYLLPRN